MPLIQYQDIKFKKQSLGIIAQANRIIAEYTEAGFELTLRQLYYQFVSRNFLKNTEKSYKSLGSIINDARLAGMIDWDCIVDRTRFARSLPYWNTPADGIRAITSQFRIDKWEGQDWHVEVWIEKDALVGVIEGVCNRNQVTFFSCRGYTSQSEMWGAAQRLKQHDRCLVIHLGDHDPSGIDMSRDIEERLNLFMEGEGELEFKRIALNMDQVQQYEPPPNPAKLTDSRSTDYIKKFGDESWELDALDPKTIDDLIEATIEEYKDQEKWEEKVEEEDDYRRQLNAVRERWTDVVKFVSKKKGEDNES
jgi:hypothetical protein